jgi:hypothetical protein
MNSEENGDAVPCAIPYSITGLDPTSQMAEVLIATHHKGGKTSSDGSSAELVQKAPHIIDFDKTDNPGNSVN